MKTKNRIAGLIIALIAVFTTHQVKAQISCGQTIQNNLDCMVHVFVKVYRCSSASPCNSYNITIPANTPHTILCGPSPCPGTNPICNISVEVVSSGGTPASPPVITVDFTTTSGNFPTNTSSCNPLAALGNISYASGVFTIN